MTMTMTMKGVASFAGANLSVVLSRSGASGRGVYSCTEILNKPPPRSAHVFCEVSGIYSGTCFALNLL